MIHSGIDLVDTRRITKIYNENKESFLARICTESEREYLQSQKRVEQKLAGIFALKEAFSKAVGTGVGDKFSFHDLEVSYTPLGQPRLRYSGKTFFKAGSPWNVSCSLSHEGDLVAAVVIIEGDLR